MINFTASGSRKRDGQPVTIIGLGLSEGNITRLKEGLLLYVDGTEMGHPELDFTIVYGRTEAAIVKDLQAAGLRLDIDVHNANPCSRCLGSGKSDDGGPFPMPISCPACDGTGVG